MATSQKEELTEKNENREWDTGSKKNKIHFLIQVTLLCLSYSKQIFFGEEHLL